MVRCMVMVEIMVTGMVKVITVKRIGVVKNAAKVIIEISVMVKSKLNEIYT